MHQNNIMGKLIGVSGNWLDDVSEHRLVNSYVRCISENGGIPIVLPVTDRVDIIGEYCKMVDALLLTGGGDIDPKYWGEEWTEMSNKPSVMRDMFDIALARVAYESDKKTLGICRGMQAMAIVSGGTIFQDIYRQVGRDRVLGHSQKAVRSETSHKVLIDADSNMAKVMGCTAAMVNTFHHQAVRSVGDGCRITARAEDGIIEGIEMTERPMIGVQWHPEELFGEHEEHKHLFEWLIK